MASAWDETPLVPGQPARAPQSAWDATPGATTEQPKAPMGDASKGGRGAGFVQGLRDPLNGAAQLLYNAVPSGVRGAVDAADSWLYAKTGGLVGSAPGGLNQAIAQENATYEANREAAGRTGFDWMRAGGNIVATAPLAAVTGGQSVPATMSATVGRGALSGALTGGLSPVTTEGGNGFWSEKLKQAATGAAAGSAGAAGVRTVAGLMSPTIGKAQQILIDSGVKLTPGQLVGGATKRVEDAATSVPVLGDVVKNAQRRSFASLNDAAINRSLAPIGEKLPKGVAGREAIAYADKAIENAYSSALARVGTVRPDAQFGSEMSQLVGMVQNLPKDKAGQLVSILKNEVADRVKAGAMTAEAFKAADSNIGQIARGYLRSQDYDTAQLGAALLQAQSSMRQMLERTAPPEHASAMRAANAAFANFLRPQRAASSLGAEGGIFTPEQLQNAVKALDPSKRKGAFSEGRALMQDLSESAKTAMGNKVPDSGTPLRHAVQVGIGAALGHQVLPEAATSAAAAAAPAAGLAALLMSAPYTQLGQKVTQAAIASRPEELRLLAELFRKGAVPAGALAPALANAQQNNR